MVENTSKRGNAFLWIEKYRPEVVQDILLPAKYKKFFEKILKDKDIPNMLLYSSTPGSGKTTIAKENFEERLTGEFSPYTSVNEIVGSQ